jgi:hypothetical protein
MFKTKEDQYNRIFQLFERVEKPYKPLLLEGDGGPSGFEEKWFDSTTGNLFDDKEGLKKIQTFKVIANANREVADLRAGDFIDKGYNYWIVELINKTYLLVVSPVDYNGEYEESDQISNKKIGSGIVRDIYNIHIK